LDAALTSDEYFVGAEELSAVVHLDVKLC